MQTSSFRTILAAGISLFIISCNNSKKDKVKVTEIKLQDITQEEKDIEPPPPPPPPPPKVEMKEAQKSCYANDGLKYATVVTIYSAEGENTVLGNVTSEDLESGKKETAEFTGTKDADKITVKFKGNAPVVGAASEWTDKPWKIVKKEGKGNTESLSVIFNAKNYDTNKWKDTEYLFALVDCK
ncbi:MAG: hypothetical protein AAB221_11845 [Bacteroidota bacterium]